MGDSLSFATLPPPTDSDIVLLATRIARRLTRIAQRHIDSYDPPHLEPDDALLFASAAEALRPPGVQGQTGYRHLCARVGGFLRNHRESIAAMDFFVVFTLAFRPLFVWFALEHTRRRILHFNVTAHPTASWVIQQLREAFPYDTALKHLIFDRDSIFSAQVVSTLKAMGTNTVRTAYRSPRQNPYAERWVGSVRRELLDNVIVLSELHLLHLLHQYVRYSHVDRSHIGLAKETPESRAVQNRPSSEAKVVALPRVGGLHHRYEWHEAA
jgi:transposase InsO family protein